MPLPRPEGYLKPAPSRAAGLTSRMHGLRQPVTTAVSQREQPTDYDYVATGEPLIAIDPKGRREAAFPLISVPFVVNESQWCSYSLATVSSPPTSHQSHRAVKSIRLLDRGNHRQQLDAQHLQNIAARTEDLSVACLGVS